MVSTTPQSRIKPRNKLIHGYSYLGLEHGRKIDIIPPANSFAFIDRVDDAFSAHIEAEPLYRDAFAK